MTDEDRLASGGDAEPLIRSSIEHLRAYLQILRAPNFAGGPDAKDTAEKLYLIDRSDTEIVELLGFRLRGHPFALLAATRIAHHERTSSPNSRAALAQGLTTPPRASQADTLAPPGAVAVQLPQPSETIPEFMARVRAGSLGHPLHIDPGLIDFAFDFRFVNPSGVLHFKPKDAAPVRCWFRTSHGHVIAATSYGLRQTLHRDTQFFTLTEVIQHTLAGAFVLPTLTVNRKFISLAMAVEGGGEGEVTRSMAFHPATAVNEHLLGLPFQAL